MKNLALVVVLFMFVTIGKSQTEKGTYLLGGNASFQSVGDESVLSINPNIGYFIANKFALGLNAGFTSFNELNLLSLGPNVRGYFLTSEKGSLFASVGFNYTNVSFGDDSESETGYTAGIGYAVFLNPAIALEMGANYSKLSTSNSSIGTPITNDGLFAINVGFQIHFNR